METLYQPAARPPPSRRMKARAPPPPVPPVAPRRHEGQKISIEPQMTAEESPEELKENMLNRKLDVTIILPSGDEKTATVEGSKAMMDLLVELCSLYHLNPAHHFLQITSSDAQAPIKFKPNTLIGTLEVHTVLLKEKIPGGKTKKPPPRIPEKSIRLVVNFLRTQKTVLRVNPEVPVREILPAICEKCEFRQEHVTLLRDIATKEALNPAKSLNELGLKELYVWNSDRDANRNSSLRNDSVEKEKKGLLGIFRINKKSNKRAEPVVTRRDSEDVDEEVFELATSNLAGFAGCSTVPNSPTVTTRPIALGTSVSLTNISGITDRAEVKKRRAPPPPSAMMRQASGSEESGEDKRSLQILQTSQNDLQMKKRRAPAPPRPVMPNNRTEEKENRKSAIGNGRQVPQKPPRGRTPRAPPRLVLPPPPPYPPPDFEDPLAFHDEADFSNISELTLEPGWQIAPGNSIYIDDEDDDDVNDAVMDVFEVEESASMNSCLASEGTTEDSGTVSSQSDITSLDYQNNGTKLRDKAPWAEEDTTLNNVTYTAKMCPVRNISVNSDDSGTAPQSPDTRDEELMSVRNGEEDRFITAQFQQTLAELDDDSEGMEDNEYSTSGFSESSPTTEVSSSYQNEADCFTDVAIAVPVTIIDEVPEFSSYSCEQYVTSTLPLKVDSTQTPCENHGHTRILVNENNNAGSFDKESTIHKVPQANGNISSHGVPSRTLNTNGDLANQQWSSVEASYRLSSGDSYQTPRSSFKSEDNDKNTCSASEREVHPVGQKPSASSTPSETVKESTNSYFDQNDNHRSWTKKKTEPELGLIVGKPCIEHKSVVQRWPLIYEPKAGMTTFKVIPPKPDVKQYDRGVSLSSSAIKIDELGNLITPHTNAAKRDTGDSSASDSEGSLLRRAKEFWRSNSAEKQFDSPTEYTDKKPLPTPVPKARTQETENKLYLSADRAETISPPRPLPSRMNWRDSDLKENQPAQVKIQTAPDINKAREDFSFPKPYRRTSSQYVASAITRYINTERQSSEEEAKHEDRTPTVTPEPKEKKMIILSKYSPPETQEDGNRGWHRDHNSYKHREWAPEPRSYDSVVERNRNTIEPVYRMNQVNLSKSINAHPPKPSSEEHIIDSDLGYGARNESAGRISSNFLAQRYERSEDGDFAPSWDYLSASVPHSTSGSFPRWTEQQAQKSVDHVRATHSSTVNSVPTSVQVNQHIETKPVALPRRISLESDVLLENSVFGPKKKFKPVVQKPAQKDMSPHSALMESIQSGEGKQRLRSVQDQESVTDGSPKKNLFVETVNERSALLSAIRASGNTRLRKVSSSASEELQSIRNAALQQQDKKTIDIGLPPFMPPPPPPPPPLPPTVSAPSPKFAVPYTRNSKSPREELMEAIRSGNSATRLKKVSPSPNTL